MKAEKPTFVEYIHRSCLLFCLRYFSHFTFLATEWGQDCCPHLLNGKLESWRLNGLPKPVLPRQEQGQESNPRATPMSLEPIPLRTGYTSSKTQWERGSHDNYYSSSFYNVHVLPLTTEHLSSSARIKRRCTFLKYIKWSLLSRTRSIF